ncbi:phosphodiester glycosidase family protein [Candidatus Acetothermia bacterium]|nr:phosphodiester glycosidase family protein [Candidatus Acetothermia bacterium]
MRRIIVIVAVIFTMLPMLLYGADSIPLYLDLKLLQFDNPPFRRDGQVMVPIVEFSRYLGATVDYGGITGQKLIRWPRGITLLPGDYLHPKDGIYYIALTDIVALIGASLHRFGDAYHVRVKPVLLKTIAVDMTGITLRFDSFLPVIPKVIEKDLFVLRFYNCRIAPEIERRIDLDEGKIRNIIIDSLAQRVVEVQIQLRFPVPVRSKSFVAEGFFSVQLLFDQTQSSTREIRERINPHIQHHEIVRDFGWGTIRVNYLYIANWRNYFRLVPVVPKSGIGELSSLAEMARRYGAVAAINANFFDTATGVPVGLLIQAGTVLSINHSRRAALGIDFFGRLTFFRPKVNLFLRHRDERITLAAVNRPMRDNEIVVYTPKYIGPISRPFGRLYRIITLRHGRVVSIRDSQFITAAPGAYLIVASGNSKRYLRDVQVGDMARIGFTLDPTDPFITNAVSAGPLLISDGIVALDLELEAFVPDSPLVTRRTDRSLIAVDRLGGLIFLTVNNANFADLITILNALPKRVQHAMALDGGHASSMVLLDGTIYREFSRGGRVAVGLILLPHNR